MDVVENELDASLAGPTHLNPDIISLEEFANSIQRGHDDIAAGRYYSLDELDKIFQSHFESATNGDSES